MSITFLNITSEQQSERESLDASLGTDGVPPLRESILVFAEGGTVYE